MTDNSVLRLAGLFSLLSVGSIIATIILGVASGGARGPMAIDFGDAAVLRSMQEAGRTPVTLSFLALLSPVLSLPAGLGWHRWLGERGGQVLVGVVLWYIGMVFVIWQDALEFALVSYLPAAFGSATAETGSALQALGGVLGWSIELFTILGDIISFTGIILVSTALWGLGGKWRLLAAAGIGAAAFICIGLLVPAAAPIRLPGFILFVGWMAVTGVSMLRAAASRSFAPAARS